MGAKTSMLVYAEGDVRTALREKPALDTQATRDFVERLHRKDKLMLIEDGTLLENANPDKNQIFAGCFRGFRVLCTREVALDHPSQLHERFIDEARTGTLYLHAMHSVVDWFAYGIWTRGELIRGLSLSPDSGILENIGDPLPFEAPYWAGQKTLEADPGEESYPLPFHPLDLAESALRALFGFNYEGSLEEDDPDLEAIALLGFARKGGIRRWLPSLR